MKLLVTAEQMKTCDLRTSRDYGVPSIVLMERAALAVAEELQKRWKSGRILAVCGPGNNGGDGAAAARILKLRGYDTEIFLTASRCKFSEAMKMQMEIAEKYSIPVVNNPVFDEYTVIIDAVFGTGLSRPVTGSAANIIHQINGSRVPVLSVDIPSGIHADTGEILGTAVQAETTVTMAFEKPGLLLPPGSLYSGQIITAEIGIRDLTDREEPHYFRMEKEDLGSFLSRNPLGNKGTFGKLLVVAGSREMCGAALLCSESAFRSGVGMLRVFTEGSNRLPFLMKLPEAMLSLYRDGEKADCRMMEYAADWADLVLLGPGMGSGETASGILDWFLQNARTPLVLDADALNLISRNPSCLLKASGPVVITPHMGEMSRLTGKSVALLKRNPVGEAMSFSRDYHVICVLKDARTVITSPDGHIYVNTSGCSALATAGSGDVLAGLIASFLAQQTKAENPLPADLTTAAAVYLHGMLGEIAASGTGDSYVLAKDLIRTLADIRDQDF